MNSAAIELAVGEAELKALSPEAAARFTTYLALLLKWNAKLNLTAIRQPEAIIRRHFIECIQCAQALPDGPTLLDFGSGAGLPGIPITICRPEIRVTLGESQRKKAAFLREALRSLELDAEVFDRRIEELPPARHFSIVTLRAVDKMAAACRVALARMVPEGWLVLFVTTGTAPELRSALPEVDWRQTLSISGLATGRILFGQLR